MVVNYKVSEGVHIIATDTHLYMHLKNNHCIGEQTQT